MQELKPQSNQASQVHNFRLLLICLSCIFAIWSLIFWQGIRTAVDIWLISEIFNHCLFVLPGVAFLIYLKRAELNFREQKPSYLVLVLCLGSLTLYAVGLAGDVQLFMHVATFSFLPLSIWAFIGHRLAYRILFPLVFILFCIPVGEELVPALQEITADLSMVMLNWSGIPVYRSGLYIEIPQGQFLVAEACSGISFFIASIVIGSLYAYLNISSVKRRVAFMTIAFLFPIIANAIRVFGIIITGYLTDMEHAVGADHLIYGWIFFSLVIVCLLGIGELIRDAGPASSKTVNEQDLNQVENTSSIIKFTVLITSIMLLFGMWFLSIGNQLKMPTAANQLPDIPKSVEGHYADTYTPTWRPEFERPYQEFQFLEEMGGVDVDIYIAWYPKGHGELISSLNKLYPEKAWALESKTATTLATGLNAEISTIVNPQGKRLLSYWYLVDGKKFTNKHKAKLYEIYKIMSGSYVGSGLIAISQTTSATSESGDILSFGRLIELASTELNPYFDFEMAGLGHGAD